MSIAPRLNRIACGSFDDALCSLLAVLEKAAAGKPFAAQIIIIAAKASSAALIFCDVERFVLDNKLHLGRFISERAMIISSVAALLPATPMRIMIDVGNNISDVSVSARDQNVYGGKL